jgi:hypothetical protein
MSEPKFRVGDLVKCKDPSHPGENPFVIGRVHPEFPIYYRDDGTIEAAVDFSLHENCIHGCIESELELVPSTKEGKA